MPPFCGSRLLSPGTPDKASLPLLLGPTLDIETGAGTHCTPKIMGPRIGKFGMKLTKGHWEGVWGPHSQCGG